MLARSLRNASHPPGVYWTEGEVREIRPAWLPLPPWLVVEPDAAPSPLPAPKAPPAPLPAPPAPKAEE